MYSKIGHLKNIYIYQSTLPTCAASYVSSHKQQFELIVLKQQI